MIRVVTQISHIFTMISILFTVLLCSFSVHVTECTEIQKETTYIYNYGNFFDIFRQGDRENYNIHRYEDFDTGYEGPHTGGAFSTGGSRSGLPQYTTTNYFNGYILDISTTHYCGGSKYNAMNLMVEYLDGHSDFVKICNYESANHNWHYNYTWIPSSRSDTATAKFRLEIQSDFATEDRPNVFDEIRIRTTDVKPPPPPSTTAKPPPQSSTTSIPVTTPSFETTTLKKSP